MNILVIDDSPQDRDLVKEYLAEMGNKCGIDNSETLDQGLSKLKNNEYDAVLLDLGLPDSSGIDTVKTVINFLKGSGLNPRAAVIILTGLEDYKLGKEALDIGAKDFLIKDATKAKELDRAVSIATYDSQLPSRSWFRKKKKRRK